MSAFIAGNARCMFGMVPEGCLKPATLSLAHAVRNITCAQLAVAALRASSWKVVIVYNTCPFLSEIEGYPQSREHSTMDGQSQVAMKIR